MKKKLVDFFCNQDGSPAIEYSIIAGLISVVIILSLTLLGNKLDTLYATIKTSLLSI